MPSSASAIPPQDTSNDDGNHLLAVCRLDASGNEEWTTAGYTANKYVRKYGLCLLPSLYDYYNPMTYTQAQAKEKELAEELRAQGYAVWQN